MKDISENTGAKQAGKFQPGQSGNPAGKPKGARHKVTLAVQALLEGEAETISRKAVELAKEGDMTAIKLVLERVLPPRKDAPVLVNLPKVSTPEEISMAMDALIQAVAAGELTPQEGQAVASLLEGQRRVLETTLLARKLEALQAAIERRKQP